MKAYTYTYIANHLKPILMTLFLILPFSLNAADRIYWSAESSGIIQTGDLDGSSAIPSSLVQNEGGPCGMAIDTAAGKIYWTNFYSGGLRVANLDGSNAKTLFDDGSQLCGVAINPVSKKIYWASFSNNAIRSGNLDGTGATTLYQEAPGSAPSGVAIDPLSGKIYWTNQFSDEIRVGNIEGNIDGLGALTLISGEDNPIGVAIDTNSKRLYWAQLGQCCDGPGSIRSAKLDGTDIKTLYAAENAPGGVAIDPEANKIYWVNFSRGIIRVGDLDASDSEPAAASLYKGNPYSLFPVLLKSPRSTSKPNISGGAKVGKELTCEKGGWASDLMGGFLYQAPTNYTYQWQINGVDVANGQQETLLANTAGDYTCVVTASNLAGSASKLSSVKKVKDK